MRTSLDIDSSQWPELWKSAYRLLEQDNVQTQLKTWVEPLEWLDGEKTEAGLVARFCAPNDFSVEWVRDHYQKKIEAALSQVSGVPCTVVFEKKASSSAVVTESQTSTQPEEAHMYEPVYASSSEPAPYQRKFVIDPKYTFDRFVVGTSNEFAFASAVAVAERPATQYNPLFIHSSPGLGKTHLLHAIANHVLSKNPNTRIGYLSAENFVNELIESLRHQQMSKFRSKFRDGYDILLIDDIQFIARKDKSEEEFFHTFNTLYATKRQIVLTSDRPPKEIDGIAERIRTRFEWGLVADIQLPEIETRIAILKAKAELEDVYLPDEVATFLATHIKSDVRELEGVLIKLQAQASLTGAEISLEMAKKELKNHLSDEGAPVSVETIQTAVAKHFQIRVQDLKATTRMKSIAMPRQIAFYLTRKYTSMGLKEIGQFYGGKDHSTILHGCQKIEKGLESDPSIRESVEAVQNLL